MHLVKYMENIIYDRNNLVYGNTSFYVARIRALRELRAQRKKWCRKSRDTTVKFCCWPRNRSPLSCFVIKKKKRKRTRMHYNNNKIIISGLKIIQSPFSFDIGPWYTRINLQKLCKQIKYIKKEKSDIRYRIIDTCYTLKV